MAWESFCIRCAMNCQGQQKIESIPFSFNGINIMHKDDG